MCQRTEDVKFYFAPMEGMTGYLYRNAHHDFFPGMDKYFSPFISTNQSTSFKTKELKDLLTENNKGLTLVPQVLTNHAGDFISTAKKIEQMGYSVININLGCPSGTVVAKNKGSGFLAKREELDRFLDQIFSEVTTSISIKTRLGKEQPEEFYELIKIFNKYPLQELIIHPRIQKDIYKNKPNLEVFSDALQESKNPVCYNGDLFTVNDYLNFRERFPTVETVMFGRGLLSNPALADEINGRGKLTDQRLKEFHDRLYEDYRNVLSGDRNILFKMKALWFYWLDLFPDNEKNAKKIRKAEHLCDYDEAVATLFRERTIEGRP